MLPPVLDKEAQLAQPASERRRRISPSLRILAVISFVSLLAASSLLYYQVGGTTTIQRSLDDAKVYLAQLGVANHYGLKPPSTRTYAAKSSAPGVRPSTVMRISATEPDLMLRIPVESINLSDSERVVLTFQYPPQWSATECMLSILSAGDDDYLMDGRRLEEQIALSNPRISSWNSKPFIYRHIDTWSLGDVATPFSCSPHQDVIVELSCRGINCIAEFRETDRAGIRLFPV